MCLHAHDIHLCFEFRYFPQDQVLSFGFREFGYVCSGDEATITSCQQAGSTCRSPLQDAVGIECKII